MWFETIEGFYKDEFYTNDDVKIFVVAKMISEEEYKKITGQDYIG